MDHAAVTEQLQALQRWRTQLVGLGLLPPDVTALLAFIQDADGSLKALVERRAALGVEAAEIDGALESRRAALKVLDAEVAAKQGTVARLGKEAAQAEAKLADATRRRDTQAAEHESRVGALRATETALRARVADLEQQVAVLTGDANRLTTQVVDLKAERARLAQEVAR